MLAHRATLQALDIGETAQLQFSSIDFYFLHVILTYLYLRKGKNISKDASIILWNSLYCAFSQRDVNPKYHFIVKLFGIVRFVT